MLNICSGHCLRQLPVQVGLCVCDIGHLSSAVLLHFVVYNSTTWCGLV